LTTLWTNSLTGRRRRRHCR